MADQTPDACPECGAPANDCERQVAGGLRHRSKKRRYEDLGDAEKRRIDMQLGMEVLQDYDEMAEQILSGELELNESRTIEELRPQVPERLRKRYY